LKTLRSHSNVGPNSKQRFHTGLPRARFLSLSRFAPNGFLVNDRKGSPASLESELTSVGAVGLEFSPCLLRCQSRPSPVDGTAFFFCSPSHDKRRPCQEPHYSKTAIVKSALLGRGLPVLLGLNHLFFSAQPLPVSAWFYHRPRLACGMRRKVSRISSKDCGRCSGSLCSSRPTKDSIIGGKILPGRRCESLGAHGLSDAVSWFQMRGRRRAEESRSMLRKRYSQTNRCRIAYRLRHRDFALGSYTKDCRRQYRLWSHIACFRSFPPVLRYQSLQFFAAPLCLSWSTSSSKNVPGLRSRCTMHYCEPISNLLRHHVGKISQRLV